MYDGLDIAVVKYKDKEYCSVSHVFPINLFASLIFQCIYCRLSLLIVYSTFYLLHAFFINMFTSWYSIFLLFARNNSMLIRSTLTIIIVLIYAVFFSEYFFIIIIIHAILFHKNTHLTVKLKKKKSKCKKFKMTV